ncbi:Phr family secreted Rap phosphatase inhibitor [Bacillus pseudomycoides]|nr:Phr family secreted Rap phosphatase inhibitor [Bacillus pseudomycoides]
MKKLTRIVMGLSLAAILSLGLTFPSQSEQSNPVNTQYSHADTW